MWQDDLLSNFSTICRTSTEVRLCCWWYVAYVHILKIVQSDVVLGKFSSYFSMYSTHPIYIFHHANHVSTVLKCVSIENHQGSTIDELLIRYTTYVYVDYDNRLNVILYNFPSSTICYYYSSLRHIHLKSIIYLEQEMNRKK